MTTPTPANLPNKKLTRLESTVSRFKVAQRRLSRVRGLIQGIPSKPTFEIWDTDYDCGYEKGRAELAAEIRAALNGDPFEVTEDDKGIAKSRNRRQLLKNAEARRAAKF